MGGSRRDVCVQDTRLLLLYCIVYYSILCDNDVIAAAAVVRSRPKKG